MDLHLRPRILLLSDASPAEVREAVLARINTRRSTLEARVASHQVMAWIAADARKLWSPCLDLNCRPHPKGTLIVGRLGPHMFLYTAMLFSFIGTGFLAAVSLCWAYVQWSFDEPALALAGTLPLVTALIFFGVLDRVGRRRARDQMIELAGLVDGLGVVQDDEEGVLREVEAHRRATDGSGTC